MLQFRHSVISKSRTAQQLWRFSTCLGPPGSRHREARFHCLGIHRRAVSPVATGLAFSAVLLRAGRNGNQAWSTTENSIVPLILEHCPRCATAVALRGIGDLAAPHGRTRRRSIPPASDNRQIAGPDPPSRRAGRIRPPPAIRAQRRSLSGTSSLRPSVALTRPTIPREGRRPFPSTAHSADPALRNSELRPRRLRRQISHLPKPTPNVLITKVANPSLARRKVWQPSARCTRIGYC